MNIVIVDHYAGGPGLGMEFRPYYFAREWMKAGHRVAVVGGSFSHVRNRQPLVDRPTKTEVLDGVTYFWIKTNSYEGNGIRRVWSMLVFSFGLYTKLGGFLAAFGPDLIIASSTYPLENFPISRIAKKFNCKYCYEVHDLWPLSPIELGGISKYHPFMLLLQWAENFAYRHADFVVSLLPAAKPHMVRHGMKAEKFIFIPNGVAIEEWNTDQPVPQQHANAMVTLRRQFKSLLAYAGSHGIANSLDSLLDAGKLLLNNDIAIVLVGDGPEKERLHGRVRNEGISNVFFLPPVPKRSIPSLLLNFDILYIGLQRQSLFRFGISPNKMIDYMMAGKPIVQAIEAGNSMVDEHSCGIAVEPENAESIASGIIRILNSTSNELLTMGLNGQTAARNFYDYRILSKQFLDFAEIKK